MKSQDSIDKVLNQQELRFRLVVAELELAATFSDLALNTTMGDRFRRNSELAYEAYDTALRFLTGCVLTTQRMQIITNRLQEVGPKLKDLDRFLAQS